MGLVIARRTNEAIYIGDDIKISVTEIKTGQVRLSVDAPKHIEVDREEIRVNKNRERAKQA